MLPLIMGLSRALFAADFFAKIFKVGCEKFKAGNFITRVLVVLSGIVFVVATVAALVFFSNPLVYFSNAPKITEPGAKKIVNVELGLHKREAVFMLGNPENCTEASLCNWIVPVRYSKFGSDIDVEYDVQVQFNEDKVSYIHLAGLHPDNLEFFIPQIPFENTEEMKSKLGEEDILIISPNYATRRYIYLDLNTYFQFSRDKLEAVAMGINNFSWTDTWLAERVDKTNTPYFTGELYAKGHPICPGDACPWDICVDCPQNESGKLKESFTGVSNWQSILSPLNASAGTGVTTSVYILEEHVHQ